MDLYISVLLVTLTCSCIALDQTSLRITQSNEDDSLELLLEGERLVSNKGTIRKCCPNGTAYVKGPQTYACSHDPSGTHVSEKFSHFHILIGVKCSWGRFKISVEEPHAVGLDGKLHLHDRSIPVNRYCLEVFRTNQSTEITPLVCFPEPKSNVNFSIYPILMLISEPFLVVTFLIYALIPELNNLHGKCVMSHVTAVFVAYLLLSILRLNTSANMEFCVSAAFTMYFAFLSSFFWLNVMCYDIWLTVSSAQASRSTGKQLEWKKFKWYSLYGWGSPLLMLIICLVMQFGDFPKSYVKPNFGFGKCWFKDRSAALVYFVGPIGLLITANIFMFILIVLTVMKVKQSSASIRRCSRRNRREENNKDMVCLYLKLFVVMGMSWSIEVLSWTVDRSTMFWFVADLGNALQGVLIFFIFVWKRNIRQLLAARCGCTEVGQDSAMTTTTLTST